jgi:hypothetical protein
VIVWSGEDDPTDTLMPRLIAAGADLSWVRVVRDVYEGDRRYPFDPSRDVSKLAAAAAELDDVALIIVDPLVSAVSGDSHKNAEVRRGLAPLVDLAGRLNAALLGITHYSKGTQGGDPLERVSGSLAFGALARVVLGTARRHVINGGQPGLMLARVKSNIGPDGGGFLYNLEQVDLMDHAGVVASRVVWGLAVEGTPRELLAEPDPDGTEDEVRDVADWLREFLQDGERPARDIFEEATEAGFSRHQVKRAKRKIGATAKKLGMSDGWTWTLRMAEESAEEAEGCTHRRPLSSLPSETTAHPSTTCLRCGGEGCGRCASIG